MGNDPDDIINQWEGDQHLLREILHDQGHAHVLDKQPDSGHSSAQDPHRWWSGDGQRRLLASFHAEGGRLALLEPPDTDPLVYVALLALRDSDTAMH